MILKDIIKSACVYLGDTAVADYLGGNSVGTSAVLKKVNIYANLCNIVIAELAAGYIPMVATETVALSDGKALFSGFSYNLTRVLSVKDATGGDIPYEIFPTYLKTDGLFNSCIVEYEYSPSNYGLTDTVGFKSSVSATLLSYGLCAEYCVTEGRFEEAVMWRKRFTDGVERLILPKNSQTAARCWL